MNRPLGVTLAAIVLGISGVFQLILGVEAMGWMKILNLPADTGMSGSAVLVSGVITLVVAIGLFTTARWAWLLTMAVMIFRIAVDLLVIVTMGAGGTLGASSIGNIVISGIIIWYFMRSNVRAAFNS